MVLANQPEKEQTLRTKASSTLYFDFSGESMTKIVKDLLFKGFKHYAASVGLAVLCHNLVLLTRL